MYLKVEYDITNDIQLGYVTLKELEDFDFDSGSHYYDYEIRNAILDKVNNKYYVEW